MNKRQKIEMACLVVGALAGLGVFIAVIVPLHLHFYPAYLCLGVLMGIGAGLAVAAFQCLLFWQKRRQERTNWEEVE